ncbi:MAG: LysE family transporter [Bacteroidetes bacterium]|nr:LysE family transporter [Bacteroidota bacterium]
MGPLIEGIILGLTLAIFFGFGPALFALLQTTIHRGFFPGLLLAIGIFLSDLVLVGLCFVGAIQIISKPENNLVFSIISGAVLIIFGIITYTRKVQLGNNNDSETKVKKPWSGTYIFKGFFLNIANPFVWIFWMGVVVGITANYEANVNSMFIFFSATLLTVLLTDISKCFASYKIKKFLTPKIMLWINRAAGVGLFLFGMFLISKAFVTF